VNHLPPFGPSQRIGLFGGSFNPPHAGHRAVALFALKRLKLDWVWWIVSPQNPLKDASQYADYGSRLKAVGMVAAHPQFRVSDVENRLGAHTTAELLAALAPALKRGCFVWLMGADSFADLHRWHDWTDIAAAVPFAVLARPGYSLSALQSPAAIRYEDRRIPTAKCSALPCAKPPAWTFIPMPLRRESSTVIRERDQLTMPVSTLRKRPTSASVL
jgi:nicotinate-nucleotide adenylyltransferase